MYPKGEAARPWPPEPLPRGRHKLDRDAVRTSQRERILRSMLECVAADGYSATTVPRVAAAARVSPNTFYALFADKAECFMAVCDEEADRLRDAMVAAAAPAADWREALTAGMRVYLNWWRDRPESSRAYLVELSTAGTAAAMRRDATHESFVDLQEALARRARAEDPTIPPVSRIALRVLVAGMTETVAAEVRAGRLDQLPELAEDLARLVAELIAGDRR